MQIGNVIPTKTASQHTATVNTGRDVNLHSDAVDIVIVDVPIVNLSVARRKGDSRHELTTSS